MQKDDGDNLITLYSKRLGLSTAEALKPNLSTLRLLTERHLEYIPFENIALHRQTTSSSKASRKESNAKKKQDINNGNGSKNDNDEVDVDVDVDVDLNIDLAPIKLSRKELINKLLIQSQGGCCLELNGLYSMLLREMGYSSVVLVPCFVFAGKERGHRNKKAKFRVTASHFVLLVTVEPKLLDEDTTISGTCNNECSTFSRPTYDRSNSFIVDVGLGEPSLWPLEYVLDKEQLSPEGMRSRMVWDRPWVDRQGIQRQCIVLEWFVEEKWEPRLQWDINDAPLILHEKYKYDSSLIKPKPKTEALTLQSFQYVIPMLLNPKSNFAKKLVVCKLTKDAKITLAGRVLKVTSPRFLNPKKVLRDLDSEDDVYDVLETEFGIKVNGKLHLPSLEYSKKSMLWTHL